MKPHVNNAENEPGVSPLRGMREGRTTMARSVKVPLSIFATLVLALVLSLTVAVGIAFAEAAYTVDVKATAANPDTGQSEGSDTSAVQNIGAQGLYEIDANNDKFLTVRLAKASTIKDIIVSFDTTKKGSFGQRYYAEETANNKTSNSVDYRFWFPSEAATIKMEVEDTQGGSSICFIKISGARAGNAAGFKQTVQSQSTGSSASQGSGSSSGSSGSSGSSSSGTKPNSSSSASGSGTGSGSSSAAQGSSAAAAQGNSGATGGTAGSSAAGTGAGSSAAAQGTGTGTNETNPNAANGAGPSVTDATGAADAEMGTTGAVPLADTSAAGTDDSAITGVAEQIFGSNKPETADDGSAFPAGDPSQASRKSDGPNPGLIAGIIIAVAAVAAAAAYFVYMRPKRKARQAKAEAAFSSLMEGAAPEAAAAPSAADAAAAAGAAGAAGAAATAAAPEVPAAAPAEAQPAAGAHQKPADPAPAADAATPGPTRTAGGAIPLGAVSDPNTSFDLE